MNSLTKIWNQVLEDFRNELNDDHAFNSIFKELNLISLENDIAKVTANNDFYLAMAKQYIDSFELLGESKHSFW